MRNRTISHLISRIMYSMFDVSLHNSWPVCAATIALLKNCDKKAFVRLVESCESGSYYDELDECMCVDLER